MVFDVVQLENNETFLQQVEIFSRVEQVIELTTLVIWPEYIKEIVYIKILLLHLISFQYRHIFIPQELVKGIKAGEYFGMLFKICIVAAYRSEEHTSELQSLMRISYAVFCLKKKKYNNKI